MQNKEVYGIASVYVKDAWAGTVSFLVYEIVSPKSPFIQHGCTINWKGSLWHWVCSDCKCLIMKE